MERINVMVSDQAKVNAVHFQKVMNLKNLDKAVDMILLELSPDQLVK